MLRSSLIFQATSEWRLKDSKGETHILRENELFCYLGGKIPLNWYILQFITSLLSGFQSRLYFSYCFFNIFDNVLDFVLPGFYFLNRNIDYSLLEVYNLSTIWPLFNPNNRRRLLNFCPKLCSIFPYFLLYKGRTLISDFNFCRSN